MRVQYLSPLSDLEAELKPLFSNEYMFGPKIFTKFIIWVLPNKKISSR